MPGPGTAPTVRIVLSTAVPGTRVRPAPHRLLLGWAPPVGTVLEPEAVDLFAADELAGRAPAGMAGGLVAVLWDGRRRPDRVDPADLVPAAAVAAVA